MSRRDRARRCRDALLSGCGRRYSRNHLSKRILWRTSRGTKLTSGPSTTSRSVQLPLSCACPVSWTSISPIPRHWSLQCLSLRFSMASAATGDPKNRFHDAFCITVRCRSNSFPFSLNVDLFVWFCFLLISISFLTVNCLICCVEFDVRKVVICTRALSPDGAGVSEHFLQLSARLAGAFCA